MPYSIQEITDKNTWESFTLSYYPNSFLQSWNWGQFSKTQNEKPFFLGIFDKDSLVGTALFTKVVAKRGCYLTCHGGPMIDWDVPEARTAGVFNALLAYLKNLARKEKVHFIRIRAPLWQDQEKINFFRKREFVKAPMYFQAEYTLHLDLSQSTEELLANMRKNTRYGVKRAQREIIKIESSISQKALKEFFQLYQKTVNRQGFVSYKFDYFENEVRAFSADDQIRIILAKYQGETLAGAIILFYGDFAYYHHGASIKTHQDKYPSYLVQWEAIKEAKKRGCRFYDLWGIAPTDNSKHPRAGLTFFKKGFGGERVQWLQTMDLPVSLRYWLTYGYVKMERLKRRL